MHWMKQCLVKHSLWIHQNIAVTIYAQNIHKWFIWLQIFFLSINLLYIIYHYRVLVLITSFLISQLLSFCVSTQKSTFNKFYYNFFPHFSVLVIIAMWIGNERRISRDTVQCQDDVVQRQGWGCGIVLPSFSTNTLGLIY